jgi:hypothetical protein
LLLLLLMFITSVGCHRAQDGSSHVGQKVLHPPMAGEDTHVAGDATPSHSDGIGGGVTTGGGARPDAGGTTAGARLPNGDIKSGGGSAAFHPKPPDHDPQQPPDNMINLDRSNHTRKAAQKAHVTLVSETAPTSASPPPPDPDQVLQNAVESLPVGKVLFNHPSEMRMGEAKEVQVRIARDAATDISTGLTTPGTATKDQITEQQQIKVSTSMKVQLHGEPYFDVKPLTDEEQLISKTGFTEWKFTVIPLQGGKWPLHLTVTAVVRGDGVEKSKNLEVLDEQVTVQVSTLEVVQAFIGNNWQWLIGTIFIPVGAWLLPKLKKKKSRAAAA